jgi:MFS family permease
MNRDSVPNEHRRTVAAVLTDIVGNFQRIAQGDASLAVAHVVERITRAGGAIGWLGSGVFLVLTAFGLLVVGAALYLSGKMPAWQAAIAVAAPIAAAAAVALGVGLRTLRRPPASTPIVTVPRQGVTNGTGFTDHRNASVAGAGSPREQRR